VEYFPLSRAQQRIFQLEQFAGGAAGIAASILFTGELNEAAMQRALNLVFETNDALRLRVVPQGQQCIVAHQPIVFAVKHFESETQLHAWAQQQALVPRGLYDSALYDFTIVTTEDRFGLMLRCHHIAADAWAAARLISLVYQYYQNPQPEQSPAFRDYITHEQQYMQSPQYMRDRAYWLAKFEGKRQTALLAKQPSNQTVAARWEPFLTPEQMQPLRAFAQQHGLSMFGMLSTAMAVYLCRLRGQNEVCVGTTTLGRRGMVQKQTLGMFAGTVPLRFELDPNAGFLQAAQAQKQTLFSAIRHEGFGYPELLAALGSETRLYDVVVNYQNAAVAGMGDSFVGTHWYFCGVQPETLQLQANDRDNTGGLFLAYDYQLAVFTQPEIERLHARLMTLLNDAIAQPGKSIAQLEMLCEQDKQDWAVFNQSEHALAQRPVHRFLEEQTAANPQARAVAFGEQTLSYQQLDDWATRIAGHLHTRGLKPGQTVAVKCDRCLELMPLLFGIMKMGCAYLPILPAWPDERIKFILEDAEATLLIEDMQQLHDLPTCEHKSSNDPDLTAYVMYTSGSTGQPKGVRVGQGGLCNRLLWQQAAYPLVPDEMLMQKTSIAFDVSAWELFWPFMHGSALLLPEPGAEQDPRRLAELIAQHGIRTIHFVPSMLSLFLDHVQMSGVQLPSLEQVICSGEALTPALNKQFYQTLGHARLINLYGPTECTVDVLYYNCCPDDDEIPIGRPVWNTGAHVLDDHGLLLPPGEPGELCITGVQLAQGYANADLNKDRFVQHETLGRIYKTGDLCSLRADGQMLYHGREDGQIKIRGQRVELAEIERQLERISGVQRAAVCYDKTLHAFVVAQNFDENRVLCELSEHLPAHMLPQRVTAVTEFPRNANGKLDRKALMQQAQPLQKKTQVTQPVTQAEKQLMAAVCMHANGEAIDMDDAPGRCGLSSLDIVSITLALQAQGMLLRVADFYAAQDFKALAAMAQEDAQRPVMIELQKGVGEIACVGVPYGGGGFAAWFDVAQLLGMPFYALKTAHESPTEILQELKQLPHKQFIVMGSCVGAGLATALAQLLQQENRLAKLCIMASVPPPLVGIYGRWMKPWRLRGPAGINRALQKLSARKLLFGANEITQLQQDAMWFVRFLACNRKLNLHVPVQLIYGDQDPALRRANATSRWERRLGCTVQTHVIAGAKHDVIHTHAAQLAAIIAEMR